MLLRAILCLFLFLGTGELYAKKHVTKPPKRIPKSLESDYTLGGKIPVSPFYINEAYSPSKPIIFKKRDIDRKITCIKKRCVSYYRETDTFLYNALDKYKDFIEGKSIAVMGAVTPWYESIVLAYGGYPTTVEYNKIISEDPRVKVMTVKEYDQNPVQFDVIFSISSYEHDGLGRYGDKLNPKGDLQAMEKTMRMLKPGGILFLAVPVGRDHLYWNTHRVYGPIRLPMLLNGWEILDSYGYEEGVFLDTPLARKGLYQPVFVLKVKKS